MDQLCFDNDDDVHLDPSRLDAGSARPQSPMVTIAIPTFNRARHLRHCIKSALAQTYDNFEVLVSNNASTDTTYEVLKEFSDEKLRIVQQKINIGLLPNWNACLANAKGDYVVFLSDDDRVSPFMIQKAIDVVRKRPGLPIVVTLSNLHSEAVGKTFAARGSRKLSTGIWPGTAVLDEFLQNNITVTMCSVLLRADYVRANGGFPLECPHMADIAAWAPLLFLGEAGLVNEPCATFSYHGNSETSRLSPEELLLDGRHMEEMISDLAVKYVGDSEQQRLLQLNARRCFAQRGLTVLSDYRSSGGKMDRFITLLWKFRSYLTSAGPKVGLRFFALVLCPPFIADYLRQRRRGASEQLV
ncbi:glycosyltransferase family 2 protein [Tardiphaga sp. 1201_B9_N1_1]|jgi:hypothetical protein|uniref:glycosyltransferase family 2 protein n=1 Tax=unclassified Tardiphaga TaxID=2631404 RepID=UPI003F23ED49